MGSLARLCCVAVVVAVVVARPSAEVNQRDARGQTIIDSSDPVEKSRSMLVELSEAYKGGVVPVALVYDSPDGDGVSRPLRDVQGAESRHEASDDQQGTEKEKKASDGGHEKEAHVTTNHQSSKTADIQSEQETRGVSKNSKLLDLEARENDENAEFGLGIQSRNKVTEINDELPTEKPFVYNIQPLSFYSTETKEEENIINYINKIKEMRENQIKFQTSKEQNKVEERPPVHKVEEAVIVDSETEEETQPIRRKIQHFQTVIKPMMPDPLAQGQMYSGFPQPYYPNYAGYTDGPYSYPYQQNVYPNYNQGPQVIYIANPFSETKMKHGPGNVRLFDEWFPVVINNPFNEIYAGFTNIIDYGAAADVCKRAKTGRVVDDEQTTEIELPSERVKLGGSKDDSWPRVTRLKVRKGGVAIAGPGGIATAGSGGTAIVGPGGTAYTTREGTAVVGPGGRVVHVPGFPVYAKNAIDPSKEFIPPPGSRTVAEGPIVYYDNPLEEENIPDQAIPI